MMVQVMTAITALKCTETVTACWVVMRPVVTVLVAV